MKIAIIGGDKRTLYAGRLLEENGFDCQWYGFNDEICECWDIKCVPTARDAISRAKAILLPLPWEKEGAINAPLSEKKIKASEVFSYIERNSLVLGGMLPQRNENTIDYSQREDFLLYNAVTTSEGAIALAISETDFSIFGANITVIGYGRIGGYLAGCLRSLGANVTVISRSLKSRALAETHFINAVGFDLCEAPLREADIIFNTVPHRIIGKRELGWMKKDSLIIDLASLPGGVDERDCQNTGIRLIRALGLPAKASPKTAGETVFRTVLSILYERGITP